MSHLTRSITLSLGAELTGSSLIMMISSPGISLPSDGPPAQTQQTRLQAHISPPVSVLFFFIDVFSCLVTQSSNGYLFLFQDFVLCLYSKGYGLSHCCRRAYSTAVQHSWITLPGVTERTTTGFSLPATNPKPNTGSRLISTFRGAGGTNLSPSRRTSSRELLWEMWLREG